MTQLNLKDDELDGADPDNDLTITIEEVFADGAITRISVSGTAQPIAAADGEANRYDDDDGANVTSAAENYLDNTSSIVQRSKALTIQQQLPQVL